MKAMYRAGVMVAAFVFLLPLSARSEIREGSIEVSPFVGYNFFQNKQNLKDRPVYGGRIGYNFTPHWGIEGTVEFIKSGVDDKNKTGVKEGQFGYPMDDVDLTFYHLDAVYHFMPEGRFNPFVVAGVGGAHYSPTISTRDMAAFNVGVGAKYWITDRIALRADLRDYMVTEIVQETYHNVAATVGITLAFGGRERPAPAQAEAKPEPVVVVVPPPPPPPPPAAPTVSISADPATIEQGKCAKLAWSTTGASSASVDQGIGSVDPNGSRQVCPGSTTHYTVTAMGEGGTRTTSATVTVNPPPPPPPKAEVKFILLEDTHFDFDKSTLTKEGEGVLVSNIQTMKENPQMTVRIAGYASASGTEEYNQKLSERRAKTVQDYLIKEGGIAPERMTTIGYGDTRPATYEPIPSDINSKEAKSNMRVIFEIIVR
ncbi:MAG: OmpA family protein [Deltaproteobacteria bacterium]|nr:OmpA family protein [Deltaproteobacteria bacterium]